MKTRLIAQSIATALTIMGLSAGINSASAKSIEVERIVAPQVMPQVAPIKIPSVITQPKIEVVFVLDTTGSMSGLINAAKEKIWSIASTMAQAQTAPEIKMGLVAYRDRGDKYVTQNVDLSEDLDSMYSKLMDFKAQGGGDSPESVNAALYDAVHKMSWNQDSNTYKVVFLVGDAPAHMDYQDDVKYPETLCIASDKGIIINAIQSGNNYGTTKHWKHIAGLGQGNFFKVSNSGNAVAIATPFDKDLAKLSNELDKTRVYYGSSDDRVKQEAKKAAGSKLYKESSVASQARRATFNTSSSGKTNFLGEKELVDSIASGDIALESIASDELPAAMKTMKPIEQQRYIKEKSVARKELQSKIRQLAEKRDAFLKEKVEATGGRKNSLDSQIFDAIQEQSADKGLVYDKKDMKY
ncbi:vWA domain-containing protein [Leucothrix arctica]|uniref:VWFA domain-containing protein n=1 Tax=Leucothrix arctica TaxID=1481894 RepID=A0A317CCE3_9GAMM|nr:vWA domain-containing protein [Leucothrix arctica]PWQ93752.1 hypothetical protein DKT75_19270 [Leucothrix arctica]